MLLLCATFLVVMVAAVGQAVTGFGFVLIAAPLLTLLTDAPTAVVVCATLGLLVTSIGWWYDRRRVVWAPVGRIALGAAVGIPVGLSLFAALSSLVITLAVGLVTMVFAAVIACGVRLPGGRRVQTGAGLASGVLLSTTSMNGPPLVMALQAARLPSATFRATLQPAFTLQSVFVVAGFALLGRFDTSALALVAAGAPALWPGWRLGNVLFARLSATTAQRLVLATLMVSGAATVASVLVPAAR